jgi:hypothetical protein
VLEGLGRDDISLHLEEVTHRKDFLWNAMLTEYDATNLTRYLAMKDSGFSPEFHRFKKAWSRDEWNHYLGFRLVYAVLYNKPEGEIAGELEMESGDFGPIAEFLEDEFSVCLLLAYDEIATFKSYLAEFPFYKAFGDPRVFRWFQRVTSDELNHFLNCLEIIRYRYPARISEVKRTVDVFIDWDCQRHSYSRTFVFDHYWYSLEFLEQCRQLITDYFVKGLRKANFATKIESDDGEIISRRYRYR